MLSLESGQCFGASVDLADTFSLKDGETYKARFYYRSLTPAKVGEVSVWQGSAKSSEVTVRM